MTQPRKRVSIIIPVYNEEDGLPHLYSEVHEHTKSLPYNFEIIFVNDGSSDNSALVLKKLAKHPGVRVLHFSRNFGKEAATTAGLQAATGDAAILIDADLQHPPHLFARFIRLWEEGKEVVVGVKQYASDVSWFKKQTSALFYRILKTISHTDITPHACDYRLLDRKVINELSKLTERNRMLRGIIDWLGFERGYIYFTVPPRVHGTASYSLHKLVGLAFNSFTAYSLLPLKLAGYLGVAILLISTPVGIFAAVERFILNDPLGLNISGTAFLAMLLIFLVGVVLASLGLVSLYIAQIHTEVLGRPLYIVSKEEGSSIQEANQV